MEPAATMTVPEWTLADRLVKARHVAGLSQFDLAERLGVGVRTIRRAEAGDHLRRPMVMAWALACGVDAGWLATGAVTDGYGRRPFLTLALSA